MKILKGGLLGTEAALAGACYCNCEHGIHENASEAGTEQGTCGCNCPKALSNKDMEAAQFVWI